jgi:hypothetical protein
MISFLTLHCVILLALIFLRPILGKFDQTTLSIQGCHPERSEVYAGLRGLPRRISKFDLAGSAYLEVPRVIITPLCYSARTRDDKFIKTNLQAVRGDCPCTILCGTGTGWVHFAHCSLRNDRSSIIHFIIECWMLDVQHLRLKLILSVLYLGNTTLY